MKWRKASKKCRKTSSAVDSCVERSTDHPLGFVLPVRNLRSLKYLTTAQGQPQPWHLTCLYQMSNVKKRFVQPAHRGWNRRHTFAYGGIARCDELPSCLQVLSFS
jgi:hypothetical protein